MKICPVCETILRGSYCPLCRKLQKNAWFLKDGVYINRSHSLPDSFCDYHRGERTVTYLNRSPSKQREPDSYGSKGNAASRPRTIPKAQTDSGGYRRSSAFHKAAPHKNHGISSTTISEFADVGLSEALKRVGAIIDRTMS